MKVERVLPRDAIPSIDNPAFDQAYFGDPSDDVIVVDGAPPRAYPIRILSYHEVVNDQIDGRAIAVTWCPICWSAAVYSRQVDETELTFGVSGKLADDALVLYDRETESEWQQPTGQAIAGELEGTRLLALPAAMLSYARFTTDYPDGVVLQPPRDPGSRSPQSVREEYTMAPYEQYVARDAFGLYGMRGEGNRRTWDRDDLDPKTIVLGIEHDGEAKGYPVPWVAAAGDLVTDTVGGHEVIVVRTTDGIHAYEHPGGTISYHDERLAGVETTWDPVSGQSSDGRHLTRVPSRRLFAFAWQDAHGPDSFVDPTAESDHTRTT